ncbi:MAG: hypothetical protein KGR26_05035, partial [Cyanobacteria bacterium REEB65]|nr:hypothetical protein [Cyanobacteria bacterium REEB65]
KRRAQRMKAIMNPRRLAWRFLLGTAGILSSGFLAGSLLAYLHHQADAGNVAAASLAVLAAIVSAWGSQRTLEMGEDARIPRLVVTFDFSRLYLVQLQVKNIGTEPAYDIRMTWNKPLLRADGDPAAFGTDPTQPDIAALQAGEAVKSYLGSALKIFASKEVLDFSGLIEYRNEAGRLFSNRFRVSLEQHRHRLHLTTEEDETHQALQAIPKAIEKVQREIGELTSLLGMVHGNRIRHIVRRRDIEEDSDQTDELVVPAEGGGQQVPAQD